MPAGPSSSSTSPWFRRILRVVVILLVAATGAGFLYQNVSEARDRRFNPMEGRLISVDGLRMHIDCTGEGSPTVIFDSGLGDNYLSWRKVQPQIAKVTRVCSYDRAGLGYSDPSSRPRTSRVIAEELHELLQAARIAPPYILAGHSMGGLDVRLYANLYPGEVKGMVLVDASHPDEDNRFPQDLRKIEGNWRWHAELFEYGMPVGIPRLLGFCDEDAAERAAECNFSTAREAVAEMKSLRESAAQTATTSNFGDMPLTVLSRDPDKPSSEVPAQLAKPTSEAWEKMQEELVHLSTRGTQTIARSSGHYIQIDRPDIVVEAINKVVAEAREQSAASITK